MTNDSQISDREREILMLVATGATNQQIAQQLQISVNTVKVHLRNIFGKIGVVSRTEATVYAIRNGLVTVGPEASDLVVAHPEPAGEQAAGAQQAVALPPPATLPPVAPGPARDEDPPSTPEPKPAPEPAPMPQPGAAVPRAPGRFFWLALIGIGAAALLALGAFVWRGGTSEAAPTPEAAPSSETGTSQRWLARAPLPSPRRDFAVAAFDLDNQIYVIGGSVEGEPSGAVDRYDPAGDLWVSLAEKPTPVSHISAIALRGKIYVPGGEGAGGAVSDILEVYDPRERRWEQGPALPAPRSRYALAAWEGQLYLLGGWDGEQIRAEVFVYNPETERWSEGPALLGPARTAAAAISAGRLYLVGGEGPAGPLRDSASLAPGDSAQRWSSIAPLPQPLGRPVAAAAVGALLVYDAEGRAGFQYDQASDAWRPFAIPADATVAPTGALLATSIFFVAPDTAAEPGAVGEAQVIYTVVLPIP
jgi:DNA-binding CsgD family transcriptional regulator